MIGKLHYNDGVWEIEYSDYDFTGMPVVGNRIKLSDLPLPLPEGITINRVIISGNEVEFNIIDETHIVNGKPEPTGEKRARIIFPEKYPIGGYAPGSYMCRCANCKKNFMGDKRSVQCLGCANKMMKEDSLSQAIKTPEQAKEFMYQLNRIIQQDKTWGDIYNDFLKIYPTEQVSYQSWLETNYHPPIKKTQNGK